MNRIEQFKKEFCAGCIKIRDPDACESCPSLIRMLTDGIPINDLEKICDAVRERRFKILEVKDGDYIAEIERKLKSAIDDLENLLAQPDYMGVCWACSYKAICRDSDRINKWECQPKWRGAE